MDVQESRDLFFPGTRRGKEVLDIVASLTNDESLIPICRISGIPRFAADDTLVKSKNLKGFRSKE
ncbi:hypothetical protein B188_07240 [Candidatus Brocadiaceae bacterium B188]|nr:hypothetical protein [Candidatus Brocadia sapporoensis]QQR67908.1 MAG: hypothetical protein IPI25_06920 [Candidatus Brocadia sp.]RZV58013.1 MAG: hypothetical protein EX330_07075 [Candidatus Brocadia sp. BROELEC01]TWU52765.1 hypothetical protein B188_07240 [Candidatus Brocadiaceae bacterium B188]